MISTHYPKVLYDVSPHEFKIVDDDELYQMSSEINRSVSTVWNCQIYWSIVAESGLIAQQISL